LIQTKAIKSVGGSYNKYLLDEYETDGLTLSKEERLMNSTSEYFLNSPEFQRLEKMTSISGPLAERFNLTGPASREKFTKIDELADKQKGTTTKHYSIKHNGEVIKLTSANLRNGFFYDENERKQLFAKSDVLEKSTIVKRTSIEINASVHKSFSYYYIGLETQELKDKFLECFKNANEQMLAEFFDPHIKNYKGEKGEFLRSSMYHIENRYNQPHLHVHNNFCNSILVDGQYQAIEFGKIMSSKDHKLAADACFKSQVVCNLRNAFPDIQIEACDEKGKQLNKYSKVKDFRISYDADSLKKIENEHKLFEKVEKEITREKAKFEKSINLKLRELEKEFTTKTITKQFFDDSTERLQSNLSKGLEKMSTSAYQKQIHNRIKPEKKLGIDHADQEKLLAEQVKNLNLRQNFQSGCGKLTKDLSDENIIEQLTNTTPCFTKENLIEEIARNRCNGMQSIQQADDILQSSDIKYDKGLKKYFSLKLVMKEQENVDLATKLSNTSVDSIAYTPDLLSSGNTQQKALARAALGTDQLTIAQGLPGTGKSYIAGKVVEAAKEAGFTTLGISPTGKVSTALKDEAGVSSGLTIDSFLGDIESGKLQLTDKHYIVLDEAGMVGTNHFNSILKEIEKSGARMLCVGDPRQLEAVSAGNPLHHICNEEKLQSKVVVLDEIMRQQNSQMLEIAKTVSLAEVDIKNKDEVWKDGKHIDKAFKQLDEAGFLKLSETTEEKLELATKSYIDCPVSHKEKIVMCGLNVNVDEMNERIIGERLARGELQGSGVENSNGTFRENDRVMFTTNNKKAGYSNGDFGTIVQIKRDEAIIKFDNQKIVLVDLKNADNIKHSYAITVNKSQGVTVKHAFLVSENSRMNSRNLLNVALTRSKGESLYFSTKSEIKGIIEAHKRESDRPNLLRLHKDHCQKPQTPTLAPSMKPQAPKPTGRLKEAVKAAQIEADRVSLVRTQRTQRAQEAAERIRQAKERALEQERLREQKVSQKATPVVNPKNELVKPTEKPVEELKQVQKQRPRIGMSQSM